MCLNEKLMTYTTKEPMFENMYIKFKLANREKIHRKNGSS